MTAAATISSFFSRFSIPAYESNSVPDDAVMPYLTYTQTIDFFANENILQANLWYKTESNTEPNAKAREIGEAVGIGGVYLGCDEGAVWIKRGVPFCQSMRDDDPTIKRRYINLSCEFLTV